MRIHRQHVIQHARHHARAGFTILEVLMALSIGAMLLIGARLILERVADSSDQTTELADRSTRRANAERVIRDLVLRMEPTDTHTPFVGDAQRATFTSWCDAAGGWTERCRVSIHALAIPGDSGTRGRTNVTVTTSAGDTMVLERDIGAELRFLLNSANGGQWTNRWSSTAATPSALGIVTEHDTLILRMGDRR